MQQDNSHFNALTSWIAGLDGEPASPQELRDFAAACARTDADPKEQERISAIAELAEADSIIYGQAVAAAGRRDWVIALPLLRHCAHAGIGDSALHLAEALHLLGDPEAVKWFRRAAAEGDLPDDPACREP